MSTPYEVSTALRLIASAVERLSNDDLSKITEPGVEIELRIVRRRAKEEVSRSEQINLAEIVAKLTGFSSRSDAMGFLNGAFETKRTLEQIARHLDVPLLKQDKVDTLREKIIEATVGARLRSEAIKGTE